MNENMERFCFDSDFNSGEKKVRVEEIGNEISSSPTKSKTEKNHDNANKFQCHLCNEYFDQFELEMHFIECSFGENGIKEENENCEDVENNDQTKKTPSDSCEIDHLKKSRKPNSESEKRFSKKSKPKSKYECKVNTEGEKNYPCRYCDKTFKSSTSVKQHETVHTGERPYKCETCFKAYAGQTNLKNHIIRAHTDEKPFKCKSCPKAYTRKDSLEKHELNHTGEKPFQCNICQKTFALKHVWKNHERSHKGEKPYKCKLCKKSFAVKQGLKFHQENYVCNKQWKCKKCKKSYDTNLKLENHLSKIHKLYKIQNKFIQIP